MMDPNGKLKGEDVYIEGVNILLHCTNLPTFAFAWETRQALLSILQNLIPWEVSRVIQTKLWLPQIKSRQRETNESSSIKKGKPLITALDFEGQMLSWLYALVLLLIHILET